ncbi:MAG: helix-turn-helix transcriptional regulator [Clostridia bacterium]|nr:helix-turn-helix transcriptional regulator [Clostridia bacterium]
MTKSFDEYFDEQMKDPRIKAEYEALEPEFEIVNAMIDARNKNGLTQKQLSTITGITQSDISKLENANANPSLQTLKRLAQGMGMQLHLTFTPIKQST